MAKFFWRHVGWFLYALFLPVIFVSASPDAVPRPTLQRFLVSLAFWAFFGVMYVVMRPMARRLHQIEWQGRSVCPICSGRGWVSAHGNGADS